MTKDELCRLEKPDLVKLIDEGKLLYSPYVIGDTVYAICLEFSIIIECVIGCITVNSWHTNYECQGKYKEFYDEYTFKIGEIGKTVFLTKAEAEQALEETENPYKPTKRATITCIDELASEVLKKIEVTNDYRH